MTQEAIQTDVSENAEEEQVQILKSAGDIAREEIAAKRMESKRKQFEALGGGEFVEPQPETKPEEHPKAEEPRKEIETISFIDADGKEISIPKTARFRAKIDGVDEEVPVETITRSYQKGAAADRRLEESTRRMHEAEAKAAEIAAREKALTASERSFADKMAQINQQKEDGNLSEDGYRKMAEGLVKALTESEQPIDDLAKVLQNMAPKKPEQVDREALLQEAEQRIERKLTEKERVRAEESARKSRTDANDWFRNEYKDVAEDEALMDVAKGYASRAWATDPNANPKDIAKKTGDYVREWKKSLSPQTRTATPPVTPKAATSRASIGEKEQKPLTRKDIINHMRISRGQAPI